MQLHVVLPVRKGDYINSLRIPDKYLLVKIIYN